MKKYNIGIQLYSVYKEIEEYGLDAVLKNLSEAGCTAVEFAGFYGLTPAELNEKLKKYNLTPLAAHEKLDVLFNDMEYIDLLGIKRVYIPSYRATLMRTEEGFADFIRLVKEAKEALDARGVMIGYHNHAKEFLEGIDLVDKMTKAVEGFTSELDIYWAKSAGKEPAELIKQYGKRISALHVKDMDLRANPAEPREYPNAVIGEGQCNAKECVKLAKSYGVDTFILEVEEFPCNYKEYVKISCERIKEYLEI